MAEESELLFFDTFSHESSEEINLDLVQFTKTVCITEVRIIPLGARVQADFPGGVRLGATNPSQFEIEFFVNDLSKPGASVFESLGGVEYNQNGNIHLECEQRIPTDGLVLRGWYTTITLAVYGYLTKAVVQEVPPPGPRAPPDSVGPTANAATAEWVQQHAQVGDLPPPEHPYMVEPTRDPYSSNYSEEEYVAPHSHQDYSYQEQWSQGGHGEAGYDAPKEGYEGEILPWEGRGGDDKMHWERNKERDNRHRPERDFREQSRDRSPSFDRGRGDFHRGDIYRGGHPPMHPSRGGWQGEWAGKRPRSPPLPPPQQPRLTTGGARTPPPPVQDDKTSLSPHRSDHGSLKRGASSPVQFESFSPGDVESISEGEIPEAEGEGEVGATPPPVSPPQQDEPSLDAEQFEPILSDEEIADDSDQQFQDMDYDFNEYSDDPLKPFNPYNFEQRPLLCLSDPAISSVMWEEKRINRNLINNNTGSLPVNKSHLEDVVVQGPENLEAVMVSAATKEDWVHVTESATNLLHKNLPYVQDKKGVLDKLLAWVDIGLDFEAALSQPQPGYKVRHIKAGVRLVEAIAQCSEQLVDRLIKDNKVHKKLIDLFHKDYMALSIKLMILKSLDVTLRYENSVKKFLNKIDGEDYTGYQKLLDMIQGKQLARVKFSISSVLQKLHIFEVLEKFNNSVKQLEYKMKNSEQMDNEANNIVENISLCLEEIVRVYREAPSALSQPKRFLPVSAQFEIGAALNSTDPYLALYSYFRIHQLLESFVILLTSPGTACDSNIIIPVHEIISAFLQTQDGMKFLASSTSIINQLAKVLLGSSPEGGDDAEDNTQGSSPQLGLHLVYRLQTLMYIDRLQDRSECFVDPDQDEILEVLHNLFCLTFTAVGKTSVVHVLSRGDNMGVLLKFLKPKPIERESKLKKSPGKAYIMDLIVMSVKYSDYIPFLQKYSRDLLDIIQKDSSPELNEILSWLKPVENPSAFAYDDVSQLCEILKKNVDNATSLPGELVTAVRVLKYLGIPPHDKDLVPPNPESFEYQELKYKCVILQLFSLEGLTHLTGCLSKICEHYEQPALHAAKLVARQGLALTAFLLPAVQLIRRILTYVIKCRNTEFKDLTAISVLLQTYTLMHAIPANAHVHTDAQRICRDIIETLLAYTQPVCSETSTENEALNKSLWTLMMSEVLKYIISSPYTFLSGLSILSELLPLPLPVQTRTPLPEEEITHAVNCRKLWSAHLHSLNSLLHDLISTMTGSSYHLLLQQLKGVCIQLADLAAPTALTVTRAVLDSVTSSLISLDRLATGHIVQVLNFLAYLVTHASIKATVINLTTRNASSNKQDEQYPNVIVSLCQILRAPSDLPTHVQAQECIISVMQCLCDTELTLLPPSGGIVVGGTNSTPSDVYLANTLPSRDLLGTLCLVMLEHIINTRDLSTILPTYNPIIRTFVMLTEHDYGYFHLKNCLEKKPEALWTFLCTLCSAWSKERTESLGALSTFIELVHACVQPENQSEETGLPPRTLFATPLEMAVFLSWGTPFEEYKHPLYCLQKLLQDDGHDIEPIEGLPENVNALIKMLEEDASKPAESRETTEPLLPQPEQLLAQFSARPVFVVGEVDDDRLSATYYLASPAIDDQDSEMEQITCDLLEIAKVDLPEMNLLERVAALCRHKAAPGDLHAPAAPTTKKRHAGSVIPTDTNAKRPFVAPMRGRGFRGSVPQRGDMFRSRPPNTSRPPSLHVDDFVALETCGQQPTGPTGYNKISMRVAQDMIATRARGRGRAYSMERGGHFFGGTGPPYRRDAGPPIHPFRPPEGPPRDMPPRFPGGRGIRPPITWERFPAPPRGPGRHIRFFTRKHNSPNNNHSNSRKSDYDK
ncbi:VIR_N domain-containing protein isoform X2 [Lycorma delicatula]|uniref:VIR_N domain-containing protein isoform X2 n=1 Tax=Lycorma delicatula TaxID=130591 RepID=UPI003F51A788